MRWNGGGNACGSRRRRGPGTASSAARTATSKARAAQHLASYRARERRLRRTSRRIRSLRARAASRAFRRSRAAHRGTDAVGPCRYVARDFNRIATGICDARRHRRVEVEQCAPEVVRRILRPVEADARDARIARGDLGDERRGICGDVRACEARIAVDARVVRAAVRQQALVLGRAPENCTRYPGGLAGHHLHVHAGCRAGPAAVGRMSSRSAFGQRVERRGRGRLVAQSAIARDIVHERRRGAHEELGRAPKSSRSSGTHLAGFAVRRRLARTFAVGAALEHVRTGRDGRRAERFDAIQHGSRRLRARTIPA